MSDKNTHEQATEMLMVDYLSNKMTAAEKKDFEQLLAADPAASQELAELREMMALVEQHDKHDIPEPTEQMDQQFYAMLNEQVQPAQMAEKNKPSLRSRFWQWFQLPQIQKLVYGMGFMVVGLFLGHYVHLLNQQDELTAARLSIKDQQIQALTVLSLMDMPSANKRIMAVNLASMNSAPDERVFDALLLALNQDSNVNVRLEALDVLAKHTTNSRVRSGLVEAINQQKSPMMQVAMINLMLNLNETRAVEPIRELLQQPGLIEPVRSELNDALNELI